MPELVSAGALVAAALKAGAAAAGESILGEAGKASFNSLKSAVSGWFGGGGTPSDEALAALSAEQIAAHLGSMPEQEREKVLDLAGIVQSKVEGASQQNTSENMKNKFVNHGGQQFNAAGGTQNFGDVVFHNPATPAKPDASD